jgi:hypothetical protein
VKKKEEDVPFSSSFFVRQAMLQISMQVNGDWKKINYTLAILVTQNSQRT